MGELIVIATLIGTIASIVTVIDYIDKKRREKGLRAAGPAGELPTSPSNALASDAPTLKSTEGGINSDWGQAPYIKEFVGRHNEFLKLEEWALKERCRIIGILGMGGIGKTALAAALARRLQDQFDLIMWRTLREAPPLEDILLDGIFFLSQQKSINIPASIDKKINLFLECFRAKRCLLILDNAEAILQTHEKAGHYRENYERYGDLFRQIGETPHQSCLLFTSREGPSEVLRLETKKSHVRCLKLEGLQSSDGQELLRKLGMEGDGQVLSDIVKHYSGNPLALEVVSATVSSTFQGDLSAFLKPGRPIIGDIREVLDEQFDRLLPTEREILFWLTTARETLSAQQICDKAHAQASYAELLDALESLRRRSLIEQTDSGFTLQNVLLEYSTDRLINEIYEELFTEKPRILFTHPLMNAQGRNYIRESQRRLIVRPMAKRLRNALRPNDVEAKSQRLIAMLRQAAPANAVFGASNLIHLLVEAGIDLTGWDFSQLSVHQAFLQGVPLEGVSFRGSDLSDSVFTESFGGIFAVAFSKSGRLLAAGGVNGDIRVRQTMDLKQITVLEGHTDWVRTIAFSFSGETLASGGEDQIIILWDVESSQRRRTLIGHSDRIRSIAFVPGDRFLLSGSDDYTLRLWDLEDGACVKLFQGHTSRVRAVSVSTDGGTLASGSMDHTVRVWDIKNEQSSLVLKGHTGPVRTVAFSPDNRLIASGSDDGTIRLWDLHNPIASESIRSHSGSVRSLAFSSDGNFLASGSADQTIKIWDISTAHCVKTLQGHTNGIWSLDFNPDGDTLVSGSLDQTVRLWDTYSGQCARVIQGFSNGVKDIDFSPNEGMFASASDDQVIRLWNSHTGARTRDLRGHTSLIWSIVHSQDGNLLASGSDDQTVKIWDVLLGECLRTIDTSSCVLSATFSPDSSIIATANYDQLVRLWDVATGEQLNTLVGHTGLVWSVAFSPDGKTLASASNDQSVRLWDPHSGRHLRTLEGDAGLAWSVAIHPHGNIIATAHNEHVIQLWDMESGLKIRILHGHSSLVWSVVFSPDGQLLASTSNDQTVRIWKVSTGELITTFRGHSGRVWGASFNPDGTAIASASEDGTIQVFQPMTGTTLQVFRNPRPYEGMDIAEATGLTKIQRKMLLALGAVDTTKATR